MKTEDECIKPLGLKPKERSAQTDLMEAKAGSTVTKENPKYDDESDGLHAKQHEITEELEMPEEASSDTLETDNQSTDEDCYFPGIIFY
jgi:hypothetical protein